MAQDRSTKIITMIKWIRTIRLSTKNSLSLWQVFNMLKTLGFPSRQQLAYLGADYDQLQRPSANTRSASSRNVMRTISRFVGTYRIGYRRVLRIS